MCGEHGFSESKLVISPGSSPRVRGTLLVDLLLLDAPGIIPACAGNTSSPIFIVFSVRDHPRVCGEHEIGSCFAGGNEGSSPRVRGTRSPSCCALQNRGIIPACAGNTCRETNTAKGRRDHPRVCGEHDGMTSVLMFPRGSSPRVRGTHGVAVADDAHLGIIPACAGNTVRFGHGANGHRDHPRVCGEHRTRR